MILCVCGHEKPWHQFITQVSEGANALIANWDRYKCSGIARTSKNGAEYQCECPSWQPSPFQVA